MKTFAILAFEFALWTLFALTIVGVLAAVGSL